MRDKHSSKKILTVITGLVVAIIASTALVVSTNQPKVEVSVSETGKQNVHAAQVQSDRIEYKGQDGKTALELLKQKTEVITKQSSYGEYVDSINGLSGGSQGKYWSFYVNGAMASVGAGDYTTKSSDVIEWKFQ